MKQLFSAAFALLCGLCLAACVVVENDDFAISDPEEADLARSAS